MPKRSLPKHKMPNRKLIDQLDQAVTQLLATRVVTVATARSGAAAAVARRRRAAPASARRFQGPPQIRFAKEIIHGNHRPKLLLPFESSHPPA